MIDTSGFDELTGILYDPQGAEYPAIPAAPTKAEALAALAELKLLIFEFPFIDGPSRSVALSGMLNVRISARLVDSADARLRCAYVRNG